MFDLDGTVYLGDKLLPGAARVLATDIAMAIAAGMPSAVVLTGDTTPELLADAPPGQRPDWVLDRIDRLLPPSAWPR